MSDTGCIVTIDGSQSGDYFVPCDMVQYNFLRYIYE
nr:MAG TPA: hypothetical protein [Inoviridae sp.]